MCNNSYLWLWPKVLSFGRTKEKTVFPLFFAHLFVPLAVAEGTFVRKNKRKTCFSFVFRSLIRTFAANFIKMRERKPTTAYKEQLRERIVKTAVRHFCMNGIKAVKMDDIAQLLGISKRTLYELYDNKEDLLYETVKMYRAEQEARMLQEAERCQSVMDIILLVYREKVEEFKQVSPQFYADLIKYPRVMEMLEHMRQSNRERMMEFLHRGVGEGYFRSEIDYELVAEMFDAIGYHIMIHQLYNKYSMQQIFKSMVFSSLRGICTARGLSILDTSL